MARGRKLSDLANAEPNLALTTKIAVRLAWTKCKQTSDSDPLVRIQQCRFSPHKRRTKNRRTTTVTLKKRSTLVT